MGGGRYNQKADSVQLFFYAVTELVNNNICFEGEAGTDYSDDNSGDDEEGKDNSDEKGKDNGNKVGLLSGLFKPLDKFIKVINLKHNRLNF